MCADGHSRPLRLGVMGLVTPQVVDWDKALLDGHLIAADIVETAQDMVPQMRAEGADIIVALCHAGIDTAPWAQGMENAAYHFAAVDGINVVLTGHTHDVFPDGTDHDDPQIDGQAGQLHGKPAVMAGSYGTLLGVVALDLDWTGTGWAAGTFDVTVQKAVSRRPDTLLQSGMKATVLDIHSQALTHIRHPVARTDQPIQSHFATAAPNLSLQLPAHAQRDAIVTAGADTAWGHLPVLSAVAPFRAGGKGRPSHFIDIPKGALTLRDVAAIYPFANKVFAVRRTGAQLRAWLNRFLKPKWLMGIGAPCCGTARRPMNSM